MDCFPPGSDCWKDAPARWKVKLDNEYKIRVFDERTIVLEQQLFFFVEKKIKLIFDQAAQRLCVWGGFVSFD